MNSADKFDIFLKICFIVFIILLIIKLFILNISWILVFTPIILPILLIMKELGVFNN